MGVCECLGHKNTNLPLVLKVQEIVFFLSEAKHIMGPFLGFFEGASKCPIICFAPEKKIVSCTFRISGTLIVTFSLLLGSL
jgi:hypothetical protein